MVKTPNKKDIVPGGNRTVLERILDWSEGQSCWIRDAVRRIIQKSDIDDDDIDELISILKLEKAGELDESSYTPLSEYDLPANPKDNESVVLTAIENITHVNNLAEQQTLEFSHEGITVIYGDNGSGKSGYTRILKSACWARYRDEILNNVFASEYKKETPAASLRYKTNKKDEDTINWEYSDQPDSILSAISVYDKKCGSVHIQKKNEIAFRPYGLDIPDRLAELFKKVDYSIKGEIQILESSKNVILNNPTWTNTTTVGNYVNNINKDTKPEDLDKNIQFSNEDEERLKFLTETLSKDIRKAAIQEDHKSKRLERFRNDLIHIRQKLSDGEINFLFSQRQRANDSKTAAEIAAGKLIEENILPNVGGAVWKILWEAAREYSTKIAYPNNDFPNTQDAAKCVFCQQDLADDAKKRLQTFEKHVSGDLEKKARSERNEYDQKLKDIVFDYIRLSKYKEILEDISLQSPELYRLTKRYLASIRLRQVRLNSLIKKDVSDALPSFAPEPFDVMNAQINKYKIGAEELRKSANEEGLKKLRVEQQELQDKKILKDLKQVFWDEIDRLKNIFFLKQCVKETNTKSITALGNNIADDVITPQIRDCFQKEIVDFVGSRLRVEIKRSGGSYGTPQYKLCLLSSPETDLSTVLSEGEQTCVAIAAFLAELVTSSHKSALVFDDPVSSLDHKWRHKLAQRLVTEAAERQVIVFTHDLIFLNDIEDAAKELDIRFLSKHLTRYPNLVGVVNDNLPWDGMKILARIDALEKKSRNLRDKRDSLTDEEYKDKVRDIYDDIRKSWERALEEVGVSHVIMRHRDYINAKNIHNISALDMEACKEWSKYYSKCCDHVHDTSKARNKSVPEPEELIQDVESLASWVRDLKDAHKQISSN